MQRALGGKQFSKEIGFDAPALGIAWQSLNECEATICQIKSAAQELSDEGKCHRWFQGADPFVQKV